MSNPLNTSPLDSVSELMEKLLKEKKIAQEYQKRRHDQWNENYELYRNKVFTNRVTQRQSVNIPLMKETIKTLISKIDDAPSIEWKELSGDDYKELVLQEIWNDTFEKENLEGLDIQDKKTVMLYGRSFKKLNWQDGVTITALDIFDVIVDPLVDPLDLETARFVIHQNIFRSLREILADDRYSAEGKEKLKSWALSSSGIVQTSKNKEEWEKKLERIRAMGVNATDFPLFAAGDVIVNLTEHYTDIWNPQIQDFERRVICYADDKWELLNETLEDLAGIDFYPFVTWSEDVETNDFWSDGPADLIRTPNKIVNIWFSQLVENRTLRNFQMHWYDATVQGYTPQTYEPGPGRMLPAPGNPKDVIMPVDISGLDETLTSIDFITKLIERGSAATALEKGVSERNQITLGEVQLLVGKAMERMVAMAKFYRRAWQELAMKWYRMMEQNYSKKMTLYKTSHKGTIWPLEVYPSDWKSTAGFKAFSKSSSEQEDSKLGAVQRFQYLLTQFPTNMALRRVAQKRMLEIADLTPEEMRQVQDEEKKMIEAQQQGPQLATVLGAPVGTPLNAQAMPAQPLPQPGQPQIAQIGSNPEEAKLLADLEHHISQLGIHG